jgi:hypothetical protein
METSVTLSNVKRGCTVKLTRDLPLNHGFGNTQHLKSPTHHGIHRSGHVISNGFEAGMLLIRFDLYPEGTHHVRFNELSAARYLNTDIY